MRGWRRIGIVLSVLWFVGFFFWRMIDYTNDISNLHMSMLETCWQSATREACDSEANAVYERLRRDMPVRIETVILDAGLLAFFLVAGLDSCSGGPVGHGGVSSGSMTDGAAVARHRSPMMRPCGAEEG
jgi:hypothetical protein